MPDPSHYPDIGDDTGDAEADGGAPPSVPRWVKVAAIIIGILVVLFLVLLLVGVGGEHGPGRHLSRGNTPPASVTAPHASLGRGVGGLDASRWGL